MLTFTIKYSDGTSETIAAANFDATTGLGVTFYGPIPAGGDTDDAPAIAYRAHSVPVLGSTGAEVDRLIASISS